MSKRIYSKTSTTFTSRKNAVQENKYKRKGKTKYDDNVNTFTDEKTKNYYQFERVKTKKDFSIKTFQILNPSDVRKKQKPIRRLVATRKGGSFKQSIDAVRKGKIKKEYQRELTHTDEKGNKTFEYLSTTPPRTTSRKKRGMGKGKRYKIQLIAYFDVKFKGRRNIVVMGYSDGYSPDVKRPSEKLLLEEAERRATGEAGHLLGSSDFSLHLNKKYYRHYNDR